MEEVNHEAATEVLGSEGALAWVGEINSSRTWGHVAYQNLWLPVFGGREAYVDSQSERRYSH
jgi:hypothetical protein